MTSTLPDHEIRRLAMSRAMIDVFDERMLNAASYDLALSNIILVETPDGTWESRSIASDHYVIEPGEIVLGSTLQTFSLPDDVEGTVFVKSSRLREGFGSSINGQVDPGFSGKLTFQISNASRYSSLLITMGALMGEIKFSRVSGRAEVPYSKGGRYHGATSVQTSKVNIFGTTVVTNREIDNLGPFSSPIHVTEGKPGRCSEC